MSALELGVRTQWAWWRSRRQRAGLHTRPLLTLTPGGRHHLPGIGVETALHQVPDPYRRPLGLVHVPSTGHVSVTLDCTDRSGEEQLHEGWIADLGAWLALLSHEPDLDGCAVVVHRAPARRRVQVLVQLTWRTSGHDGATDAASLAVAVGSRVPRLVLSLGHSGVGTARPLGAAALTAVVRSAYHPHGPDRPGGTRPRWADAAPTDPVEGWRHLRHGIAASRTWSMSQVPASVVLSSVLSHLLTVPPDVARTRVTLLHRPALHRPAARTPAGPDAAGPPRFSSLVTVTSVQGVAHLDVAAEAVLGGLPTRLRPWLRPLYGSQAAAFAAGIPTGTLLVTHATAPGLITGPE